MKENKGARSCKNGEDFHFIHFKWRYGWHYLNRRVTRRARSINWWCHWNIKKWNKKQEGGFLGAMMALMSASLIAHIPSSMIQTVTSLLINAIGKKVDFFHYYVYWWKSWEKGSEVKEDDIIWIIWTNMFSSAPSFKQYQDY